MRIARWKCEGRSLDDTALFPRENGVHRRQRAAPGSAERVESYRRLKLRAHALRRGDRLVLLAHGDGERVAVADCFNHSLVLLKWDESPEEEQEGA